MKPYRVLWLLLALALVRGSIYAVVMPPWQAPDETGHFEYAWLVTHKGRIPSREDLSPLFERELLGSLYEWRYGEFIGYPLPEIMPTRLEDLPKYIHAQPSRPVLSERFSLAYLWQALFLLPVHSQDLVFQLLIARFSSVLLNLAIVWLAFITFRELLPARPRLALAMTLVIVLMPQHTFVNSTVGDGTMAELMACLVFYGWVRLFRYGGCPSSVIGITAGTMVGLWSKTTAVFLIPLDVGLGFWWLLRQRRQFWTRRRVVYLCTTLAVMGIGAWLWGRSVLGVNTLRLIQGLTSPDLFWVDRRGMTLWQALLASYDSFWALFGWMAVPTSSRWYGAILLLTLLAAFGWLARDKELKDHLSWAPVMMVGSLLAALVPFVWTALLSTGSGYYQFQGRYLFPVVIPFAFLLVEGWMQLAPSRHRTGLLLASVLFFVLFDGWCLLGYMVPYFYF